MFARSTSSSKIGAITSGGTVDCYCDVVKTRKRIIDSGVGGVTGEEECLDVEVEIRCADLILSQELCRRLLACGVRNDICHRG